MYFLQCLIYLFASVRGAERKIHFFCEERSSWAHLTFRDKGDSPGHMGGTLRSSGPDLCCLICVHLSSWIMKLQTQGKRTPVRTNVSALHATSSCHILTVTGTTFTVQFQSRIKKNKKYSKAGKTVCGFRVWSGQPAGTLPCRARLELLEQQRLDHQRLSVTRNTPTQTAAAAASAACV